MKNILVICSVGSLAVGCTTTRVDDHSFHYSSGAPLAAPSVRRSPAATTINNYRTETVNNINNNVTHNYRSSHTPTVYEQDREYLQFQQAEPVPSTQENLSPMGYRGLHILEDRNGSCTVVPARWDTPNRNPIPGHGIPVFKRL